jgi:TPR repeat protein
VKKVVAAIVCLALAMAIQFTRDRAYPRNDPDTRKLLYIRSPEALKRIALGYDALLADVYWIRAIQHYGGDRLDGRGARRYELLYPLLDIATSLDPYFNIAYRFGAIFLSEAYPGGPGRPDQAILLLRKGIAAQPTKWQYYHDIAFVHYWAMRDPAAAADWFRRAAAQPDAPNWLLPVAAAMLTQGNDRSSSRFLWEQILQSDQDWLRRRADHALAQLDALDEIDRLEAYIASLPKPADRPYSWMWITRGGVPVDPSGTPYELDPQTGQVTVSQSSLLFPLPTPVEPAK